MWLENDMSRDRVQCVVERQQTSSNLSRKEWVAVQAKDLKTRLPEDRFNELIKRRTEAGLYYPDEDYPDDDMDWFVESWAQKKFPTQKIDSEFMFVLSCLYERQVSTSL